MLTGEVGRFAAARTGASPLPPNAAAPARAPAPLSSSLRLKRVSFMPPSWFPEQAIFCGSVSSRFVDAEEDQPNEGAHFADTSGAGSESSSPPLLLKRLS